MKREVLNGCIRVFLHMPLLLYPYQLVVCVLMYT